MTRAPLHVDSAKVTTASVEIKTLTVRGKQVTQALFRQIQRESLLDDSLNYRGNPWGRVNYHSGCTVSPHHHVLWQAGEELRVDEVRRAHVVPMGDAPIVRNAPIAGAYLATAVKLDPDLRWLGYRSSGGDWEFGCEGVAVTIRNGSPGAEWAEKHLRDAGVLGQRGWREERPRAEAPYRCGDSEEGHAFLGELRALCAEARADWTRREARWREIESLPHLFIAA